MSDEELYNLQYPPKDRVQWCLGGLKTKTDNLHATITLVKIEHTKIMSWPENQGILFFFIFLKHWK